MSKSWKVGKVKYNANQENAKINIYSSMIYTTWQNKRDILNNKLTIQVDFTKTVHTGNINTHFVNYCSIMKPAFLTHSSLQ